jgi:hypothetical protein
VGVVDPGGRLERLLGFAKQVIGDRHGWQSYGSRAPGGG